MLSKYYKKAVFLLSIITAGGNLLYFIIDGIFSTYKSEWLTTGSFFPIMMFMGLANSVIIGVFSLTIFLNRLPQVKSKPILSALAWFLFPMGWVAGILIASCPGLFDFSNGIDSPGIFDFINTLPYVMGSIFYYIQFRRNVEFA